jgi:hypothetical protein
MPEYETYDVEINSYRRGSEAKVVLVCVCVILAMLLAVNLARFDMQDEPTPTPIVSVTEAP